MRKHDRSSALQNMQGKENTATQADSTDLINLLLIVRYVNITIRDNQDGQQNKANQHELERIEK